MARRHVRGKASLAWHSLNLLELHGGRADGLGRSGDGRQSGEGEQHGGAHLE